MISRRNLLRATLAAPAVIATRALALPGAPEVQNAGWFRFTLGALEITVVSDGNLVLPANTIGVNQPAKDVFDFLQARYLDPVTHRSHTNHVIVDDGSETVLVDVGSGLKFQETAGRLITNMEEAGIDPGDITQVALTHAHPDHVWGMMDDFGDEPRLPEAAYTIAAAEFDWWMAEDRLTQVPEAMQAMVVGAQNALSPVAERMTMAAGETAVAPGITMVDAPGHTSGHMGVMVESQGEQMLIAGDAINHVYASFEHPDWHAAFDADKDQAAATRKRLLDMCATDGVLLSAYHLPFPGVGHVIRRGGAFQFLPLAWQWGE